jgi:hypothetical protein
VFPDGNCRARRARMTAVIAASAALAAGCGSQPADPPVMPWQPPPAHPRCGAPVRARSPRTPGGVPAGDVIASGASGYGGYVVPFRLPPGRSKDPR